MCMPVVVILNLFQDLFHAKGVIEADKGKKAAEHTPSAFGSHPAQAGTKKKIQYDNDNKIKKIAKKTIFYIML